MSVTPSTGLEQWGGGSLDAIAAEHGTPSYVYDASVIRSQVERLRGALAGLDHELHYSVKACSNLSILRLLHGQGTGFDVVSGGEIQRCLEIGADPADLVFAGVGKTREEVRLAVEIGVGLFNVEAASELTVIAEEAERHGRDVRYALRVNPDVDAHTHEYITTGRRHNKFGLDFETAWKAAQAVQGSRVKLVGLHVHVGSQILRPDPFLTAAREVLRRVSELRDHGDPIELLNLGGGFGVPYGSADSLDVESLGRGLQEVFDGSDLRLLFEPGRFLVAEAGLLLTRVLHVKRAADHVVVITDAAMNDLLRPALYQAEHPVCAVGPAHGPVSDSVDVVGPICESADFLARGRTMAVPEVGELLAVMGAGAYGFTMSSQYNSRPRAAEILVDEGNARLIRRRETMDDLLGPERL